jgi:hypothetical protein
MWRHFQDGRRAVQRSCQPTDLSSEVGPVSVEGFRDAREHFGRIRELWRIDQMTIPRPARDTAAVSQRALRLHERMSDRVGAGLIPGRRSERPIAPALDSPGSSCESLDGLSCRFQSLAFRRTGAIDDLFEKLTDPLRIGDVIERHDVRVGEAERQQPPDARDRCVVPESGVAILRHPDVIVVH